MNAKREELSEEIQFVRFQQYEFIKQWTKLKAYANELGIQIIGDIPIDVAFDSADAWANPQLFQFDEACIPLAVAGCPPLDALLPQDSFGGIHCIAGSIMRKLTLHGGFKDSDTALNFMM